MSQVESTLRQVNGRLLGNRNWRLTADECWNFQRITIRRQLAEQEAREVAAIVNQDGITERLPTSPAENDDDLNDLDVDFYPEDYDVDPEPEPQQQNPHTELEELCQQEGDEQYENNGEDSTDAAPGAVTFDTDRTPPPPARPEDLRWHGLRDDMDAMQDFCQGEIQEHEIHLDGISSTHYYHAARHGILAADRFDIYGDRNPPAWWPILECA